MTPDVAVVLIGYNDAERLPAAVASVLNQTLSNLELVIVDDASTDGMGDVAEALAAASPKVRSVRLPTNSGGCSRPRNVGLQHIRAPYVMFLDSDDVLERHACKNLLLAIERSGADFASGRCVQVDMDTGVQRPWMAGLSDKRAVWDGIREHPELINDTLCTNKLYRVSFLDKYEIRFPEGLHYEDLAFTAEVYCSASRIAIIPEVVYYWQIHGSHPQASISRRRDDIKNFRDRLAIHRLIRSFLDRAGLQDMKALTDDRFLHIELKLYLRELVDRDARYQKEWMSLASSYLRELDINQIMSQQRGCRLTTYLVRQGDVELAIAATDLWLTGRVSVPLVQAGDTLYFADAYLDDPRGREALDVTWLRALDATFSKLPLNVTLSQLRADGDTLRLSGFALNQLERIPTDGDVEVTLRLRNETMRWWQGVDFPASRVTVDADRLTWEADVDTRAIPPATKRGTVWNVSCRISWRGQVNGQLMGARRKTLPEPSSRTRAVTATVTPLGVLTLVDNRPVPPPPIGQRLLRRAERLTVVSRISRKLSGRPIKTLAYRTVLRRLPLRPRTVVFESHLGKQYSDNPKYLYEAMTAAGLDYRMVWSYARKPQRFPDRAIKVERESWRYYYELARAGYIVDNQGLPAVVVRRPGQRYVQTWHGTPFKHMGFDEPRVAAAAEPEQQRLQVAVDRWDDFVVTSSWSDDIFRNAFRLRSRTLDTGYPRNDPLSRADDIEMRQELRQRLGLPEDRKILLYAPTFRRYPKAYTLGNPANSPHIDLRIFEEHLDDEWFIVLRAHYLDRLRVPRRFSNIARNMSGYDDVTDLLIVADAVLTDYSSIMFDYAITGRPMAFYASDYELYRRIRGSYFDLRSEAPGPMVTTTEEIVAWLENLDATAAQYAERYQAFRDRYCEFEDGSAAEKIIDLVFRDRSAHQ